MFPFAATKGRLKQLWQFLPAHFDQANKEPLATEIFVCGKLSLTSLGWKNINVPVCWTPYASECLSVKNVFFCCFHCCVVKGRAPVLSSSAELQCCNWRLKLLKVCYVCWTFVFLSPENQRQNNHWKDKSDRQTPDFCHRKHWEQWNSVEQNTSTAE